MQEYQSIRMSTKNINCDNKIIKKVTFTETKKHFSWVVDIDVNKYQFLKKNHIAQKMHLNNLLNIMIMMLLGHYV